MSQHAIPLADTSDLGRFARRTTVVRIGLLLAIVVAIGLCIYEASRLHVGQATLLGPGASGVVVLDISSSTDSAPPREIPGVLRHLANAGGRSGLVLFSDVAYEALPLGATSEELCTRQLQDLTGQQELASYSVEKCFLRKDGERVWVLLEVSVVPEP